MQKKYLIFISSCQEDLKAERRELTRIVSEMGSIPITMDTFNITQEEDRKLIRKTIGECDYFLNLTAYRAGEAIGKSFALETEYSWALKAGIPVLALIIDEKARWKEAKKEKEESLAAALEAFKKKLGNHPCETWMNMGDLKQKAIGLLIREMNLNPRRGWAPANMVVEPSVANELCRLIQENNFLKTQIKMVDTDIERKIQESIKHIIKVLALNRISLSFYYIDGENWENSKAFRFLKLFRLLAPELNAPKSSAEISHFLGNILNPDLDRAVRKDFPVPSNTIKKIMADFAVLKLVKYSEINYLIPSREKSEGTWDLTEYGKEIYAAFRLRHLNLKLHPKNSSTKS